MTRKTKYEVSYQRKRFFVSAKTDFSFCFGSFGVMLGLYLGLAALGTKKYMGLAALGTKMYQGQPALRYRVVLRADSPWS